MRLHLFNGIVALASLCAPGAAAQCEIAKLFPDGPGASVYFGESVDLRGRVAVIGSSWGEYAAVFDVGAGVELFPLVPSHAEANDDFGASVATDGMWAVVGAPGVDGSKGSAFVFDVATGIELHELVSGWPSYEYSGASVDVQGDLVAVGAPAHGWLGPQSGAVHMYAATTGEYRMRLLAYDGGPGDNFGHSIALDGDWIVVGAPGHDDHFGVDSGAAYAFHAGTGQLLLELLPPVAVPGAEFGTSVAVSGDRALIGAPYNDLAAGQAFLFDLTTGALLHSWSPSRPEAFGFAVALEDSTALVGAYLADAQQTNGGVVYRFDADGGGLVDVLSPGDPQPYLFYSYDGVAISDGRALVSASRWEDANGDRVGTAYLYSVDGTFGDAYCPPSVPNSEGLLGRLTPEGCDAVLANEVTLVAGSLPPDRVGYFLASRTQGFVSGVGGGQGDLCLAGDVARFAADAASSGPAGEIRLKIDLSAIPTSPPSSVVVGETWNFQCWYRDVNPTPTSNLTAGLTILFR